jgi:hypothetical protein
LKPFALGICYGSQLVIELHPFFLHRRHDINLDSQANSISKKEVDPKDYSETKKQDMGGRVRDIL